MNSVNWYHLLIFVKNMSCYKHNNFQQKYNFTLFIFIFLVKYTAVKSTICQT